jgi:hypothetical protein
MSFFRASPHIQTIIKILICMTHLGEKVEREKGKQKKIRETFLLKTSTTPQSEYLACQPAKPWALCSESNNIHAE